MLAGLMLGRRGLLVTIATCCALVIAIGVLGAYGAPFIGFAAQPMAEADVVSVFVFAMLLIGVLLDRAGGVLRRAFVATLAREQELRAVRAAQDEVIAERTAALQQSLEQAAAREATLQQTLAELRASEQTVRELSAPVLPVLPGVLIAPLVGALDSARAAALTTNVLQAVEQQQARTLILDITGVPTVDTAVAQIVLQTTAAVRLLGAEVLLVGIRPDVAHTMVVLGIQLRALQTFPNLEAALLALLGGRVPGQHKLAIPSRAA
jgi:anti-anti-sigma factor